MVMRFPFGTPLTNVLSVSLSLRRFWSTSCRTAVAVKLFEMLAMRKWSSIRTGAPSSCL
jgi:hypothetical protein